MQNLEKNEPKVVLSVSLRSELSVTVKMDELRLDFE
jgi:hypothetical protein